MQVTKVYQHRPSHTGQGAVANHHEVHRSDHQHHAARGHRSPLDAEAAYPKPGSAATRRNEDVASSPAQRGPMGQTPFPTNTRGGVTQVSGQHGPRGTPRDMGDG